jgi:hypothetical protein
MQGVEELNLSASSFSAQVSLKLAQQKSLQLFAIFVR